MVGSRERKTCTAYIFPHGAMLILCLYLLQWGFYYFLFSVEQKYDNNGNASTFRRKISVMKLVGSFPQKNIFIRWTIPKQSDRLLDIFHLCVLYKRLFLPRFLLLISFYTSEILFRKTFLFCTNAVTTWVTAKQLTKTSHSTYFSTL